MRHTFFPVSAFFATASAAIFPVNTTNGLVLGQSVSGAPSVISYLGIPYAKPPIGNLRFAPPEPITEKKTFAALSLSPDCPLSPSKPATYPSLTPQAQTIISYFSSASGTPQSEDCLTLNIWTKLSSTPKPVLVFFYGGRFTIRNTNTPFFTGKYLALAQEVIVIAVNYRRSIFGFHGAPGQSQNLGLRDQRAAVEWIRENIAGFGRDPDKITLMGQSSGGVSVDCWAYAYQGDPIAHGLIKHSGNAFSFPFNSPSVRAPNWNSVVKALNCSSEHPNTTLSLTTTYPFILACMRSLPYTIILSAASCYGLHPEWVKTSRKAGRLGLGLIKRLKVEASPLRRVHC